MNPASPSEDGARTSTSRWSANHSAVTVSAGKTAALAPTSMPMLLRTILDAIVRSWEQSPVNSRHL